VAVLRGQKRLAIERARHRPDLMRHPMKGM
jgi:hypothetical protein